MIDKKAIRGLDLIEDLEAAYSRINELQQRLLEIYYLRPEAREWTLDRCDGELEREVNTTRKEKKG